MPKKKLISSCAVATLALGLALAATPAFAGFEWVSPNENPGYPAYANRPYGAATNSPEIISPVIISGGSGLPQAGSTYTEPTSNPSTVSTLIPSMSALVPGSTNRPVFSSSSMFQSPAAGGEPVQGFASQIPLALALRQVLPIGYNFSIDQNVGMDTLVSFKGGKPWRETLKDMLAPAGLTSHDQGTTITVSRAGSSPEVTNSLSNNGVSGSSLNNNSLSGLPALQANSFAKLSYVAPQTPDVPSVSTASSSSGWSAQRGDTLRKVLTEWCRHAGVELQWLAEYDYPIEGSANFSGGFEDAVRNLLVGFDGARPQPIGELHTNPSAGQMVLVVQTRGNSYSN